MTQQEQTNYYNEYQAKLNKYAPLSGQGKNDKLVYTLLRSYIDAALQGLRSGGISHADFTTNLISESHFKQLFQQLYFNTGLDFAEWQYKRLKTTKRSNPSMSVGFMSEAYKALISTLLDKPIFADRIKNITDETKKQIRAVLVEANNRGLDIRQTARLLNQKIPSLARDRALLISRTESTLAASLGAQFGAKQTRLKLEKVWIATKDSRTRDAHRSMIDSKPVPMREKFKVGGAMMLFPGDPAGGARNCCNCRCCVAHIPAPDQENAANESSANPFLHRIGGIIIDELLS